MNTTSTATAKTYGPQQQRTATHLAQSIALWGAEIETAARAGDVDNVAKIAQAIADTTAQLAALTARVR
jgi:hypothetical protein